MRVSVIGAGNGGHAIAGDLSMKGHSVCLYDRNVERLKAIQFQGGIYLNGRIEGFGKLSKITDKISEALVGAEIIMIATVANAHAELADKMFNFLEEGQIVVLNPGRTCGAIEFLQNLKIRGFKKRIYIAEAQTLIYACRVTKPGNVNIIGIKDKVMLAALPNSDTDHVLSVLSKVYSCFLPASSVLVTSLENIGAIFHPCVTLFNAATIERGNLFYFYRDMTQQVADFIESFDKERLDVGRAYGLDLISAKDWISYAYEDVKGETLLDRMKNNPAYFDIMSPTTIESRQLLEDIPTGIVPMLNLGEIAGLEMPLFKSVVTICSCLLNIDFYSEGRTLDKFGINNVDDVLQLIS